MDKDRSKWFKSPKRIRNPDISATLSWWRLGMDSHWETRKPAKKLAKLHSFDPQRNFTRSQGTPSRSRRSFWGFLLVCLDQIMTKLSMRVPLALTHSSNPLDNELVILRKFVRREQPSSLVPPLASRQIASSRAVSREIIALMKPCHFVVMARNHMANWNLMYRRNALWCSSALGTVQDCTQC